MNHLDAMSMTAAVRSAASDNGIALTLRNQVSAHSAGQKMANINAIRDLVRTGYHTMHKCQVCEKVPQTPSMKILPRCFHAICLACAENRKDATGKIICSCGDAAPTPQYGARGLPNYAGLNNILAMKDVKKPCTHCGKHLSFDLASWCKSCKEHPTVCSECAMMHHGGHNVELVEWGWFSKDFLDDLLGARCYIHQSPCDYYCESCNRTVCNECWSRNHLDHEYVKVEKVADRKRVELDRLNCTLDGKHQEFTHVLRAIDAQLDQVNRLMSENLARIQGAKEVWRETVEKQAEEAEEEVKELSARKREKLLSCRDQINGQIDIISRTADFLRVIHEAASPAQQLSSLNLATTRVECDMSLQPPQDQNQAITMQFMANSENIRSSVKTGFGYIRTEGYEKSFKGMPPAILPSSDASRNGHQQPPRAVTNGLSAITNGISSLGREHAQNGNGAMVMPPSFNQPPPGYGRRGSTTITTTKEPSGVYNIEMHEAPLRDRGHRAPGAYVPNTNGRYGGGGYSHPRGITGNGGAFLPGNPAGPRSHGAGAHQNGHAYKNGAGAYHHQTNGNGYPSKSAYSYGGGTNGFSEGPATTNGFGAHTTNGFHSAHENGTVSTVNGFHGASANGNGTNGYHRSSSSEMNGGTIGMWNGPPPISDGPIGLAPALGDDSGSDRGSGGSGSPREDHQLRAIKAVWEAPVPWSTAGEQPTNQLATFLSHSKEGWFGTHDPEPNPVTFLFRNGVAGYMDKYANFCSVDDVKYSPKDGGTYEATSYNARNAYNGHGFQDYGHMWSEGVEEAREQPPQYHFSESFPPSVTPGGHDESSDPPPDTLIKDRFKMNFIKKFGEYGDRQSNPNTLRSKFEFYDPCGIALDSQGNILIVDSFFHRIRKYRWNRTDDTVTYLGGFGQDGREEGHIHYPNKIHVNANTQEICFFERQPVHQVQVYSPSGDYVTRFGGDRLAIPKGVFVDHRGNIIVLESREMRVWIFSDRGEEKKVFKMVSAGFPICIVGDEKNRLFIADNTFHMVHVYGYDGRPLYTIGGPGYTNYPVAVGFGPSGNLVVADNHNNFNLTIYDPDNGQLVKAYESQTKHAQVLSACITTDGRVIIGSKDFRIYIYEFARDGDLFWNGNSATTGIVRHVHERRGRK